MTSWADEVEDLGKSNSPLRNHPFLSHRPPEQPRIEDSVDENGIRTTVEYTINDEGKKVKASTEVCFHLLHLSLPIMNQITRKIKRVLQKAVVDHTVAERKTWLKFGQEKGNKPGPDRATTTVGENVFLKLSAGNKVRSHLGHGLQYT